MKTIIISISILFASITFSQADVYTKKMKEGLTAIDSAKIPKDFEQATYLFQQITEVEPKKWLPHYYVAFSYILASYTEKQENGKQKDAYLDLAEKEIEKMKVLVPNEAEVYALESFYNTARLIVEPMTRGMKYSGLSNKAIGKALALDANNPRAKQLQIANSVGMAQFFGKDITEDCKKAEILLNEWDNYKLKSDLHPSWGKDYLEQLVKSCQSSSSEKTTEGLTLTVKISNLLNDEGKVLIKIVDKNDKEIAMSVGTIKDNKSTIVFTNLKEGVYAVSFFHDKNGNMKFDMGNRGPEEGYGFSNNAKGFMKAPKFKKQKIKFTESTTIDLITRNPKWN